MTGRVEVLGRINVDQVTVVDRFPLPGETIIGGSSFTGISGKGANQAVAATKSGADVVMLGAVGSGSLGSEALRTLQGSGVRAEAVERSQLPTGNAHIAVDGTGGNSVVVVSGADHRPQPRHG